MAQTTVQTTVPETNRRAHRAALGVRHPAPHIRGRRPEHRAGSPHCRLVGGTGSRPRRPGRPAAPMAALLAAALVAILAGGCSTPAAKPDAGQNRRMITSLASDPQVQRAFATGRGRVMATDPGTRRVILEEMVREQRRLLEEPAVRDDALRVNAELTRATSTGRETRPVMLENTVNLLEGIPDDPELRRRLVNVMRELMKDPALRADMMAMMQSMMAQSGGGGAGSGSGSAGGSGTTGGSGGSAGSGGGSGSGGSGAAGGGSGAGTGGTGGSGGAGGSSGGAR
ncbi:hypothetical protein Tmar_2028 [Thermaerobacter marianensis DSM 12885]|uniref:Uncharacterized protein n=1 Tax=Thermaerobacter marianensis (strain ATCC 700841 / DSM 12885 / JCM 10246 / 7p75a) TaxID=644966 RepID=E6SJF4_THEM7|nr:hypothetical protein [Thermaerobacter marianensis]ADU52109.1 hypothetical protein Tmar_2028 [Thermaerobacter marianensis DSM 12885]